MKKIAWLVALLSTFVLTACTGGSYRIGVGHVDSTPHSISGSYTSFSGHYYKTEKFSQGEKLEFHFSVHTKKGKIAAEVLNSSGKTIAMLGDGTTVSIPKTGSYKIEVNATDHGGDFTLTWDDVNVP